MNLLMVCGMFVWCSLCVSVCLFTRYNALLMSGATVLCVLVSWLKHVAMVLFKLCSVVIV